MPERARVQGGAGVSPFRVSAQGATPSGARFDELIFDANAASVRIYMNGSINITPGGTFIWYGRNPTTGSYSASPPAIPFGKTFPYPPLVLVCSGRKSPRWIITSDGFIQLRPWESVALPQTGFNLTTGAGFGGAVFIGASSMRMFSPIDDTHRTNYVVFDTPVRD